MKAVAVCPEGKEWLSEVAEMVVLALDQQTAGNEGDADVGHAECRGVRQPVDKGIVGNG